MKLIVVFQITDELWYGREISAVYSIRFCYRWKTKAERYNRPFTYDKLTIMSDGNYVYILSDFKKLVESKSETINYSPIDGGSRIEQIYDVVVSTVVNCAYSKHIIS